MSAILLYGGSSPFLKVATGRHRPPQAGSFLDLRASMSANLLSVGVPARLLRVPQAATGGQLSGASGPPGIDS